MVINRKYLIILFIFFLQPVISLSIAQSNNFTVKESIGPEAFKVMKLFFNYDKGIPLEARIVERQEETEYTREKIVFNGIQDSRVPGYLAIPENGKAPYPCILQLHGIVSSKEEWWKENSFSSGGELTNKLLQAGFAVLSLDAVYHGERILNNDFESAGVFTFEKGWLFRTRDMIVQSTVEYRRAVDYLSTREDIDTSKIGMIGYSMGGMMTFILSAIDPRIKASVACVTPILKDKYSVIAVHNFAPYITDQSFLMLMGKEDKFNYTIEEAQQLYGLITSRTKELEFYETGHKLPVEWTEKAAEWVEKSLR